VTRGIPSEVLGRFHRIPLFESVSKDGLRSIVAASTEVDLPAGKMLVREGDSGRELYVILRGTAEVFRGGRKLRELTPGEFFGEMALLHPAPRTATVTARTDMRVMILDARALDVILDSEPTIGRRLLEAMAKRVRSNERGDVSH
jgi:CRP/FNR family transcriptional regulator, cyclic AMP receptor protein